MTLKVYQIPSTQQWIASISGPWYDDSNPEGQGATPEEAINLAWEALLQVQTEINLFITLGKPKPL